MHQGCIDSQHVEGRRPKVEWYLGKLVQVVITSGVKDKVRQGMLFSSNCVYRNKICFCRYTHKAFAILYNIMPRLASFLRTDRALHPNGWSISGTLDILWWQC